MTTPGLSVLIAVTSAPEIIVPSQRAAFERYFPFVLPVFALKKLSRFVSNPFEAVEPFPNPLP